MRRALGKLPRALGLGLIRSRARGGAAAAASLSSSSGGGVLGYPEVVPGPAAKAAKDKTGSPYDLGPHRSDAEDLIAKVPVIEVDGDLAVCSGGGGALGHPLEYITLRTTTDGPQTCKYCGLRYISKHHH